MITACRPTATVLVPQLLRSWLFEMKAADISPNAELRFVAVGGAATPMAILQMAELMGVPVYEGYGLSECCSVVSLNRPGDRRLGTAGKALAHVSVEIDDGEIVISSPTIMDGYLGSPSPTVPWRTGDLGHIDEDGFLTVEGRKDNLLVTAFGRNISPEWIETALMADPRIAIAVVSLTDLGQLQALLIPSSYGEPWFERATEADVQQLIAASCQAIPSYAVPSLYQTISMQEASKAMLITSNGRPIRCRIKDHLNRNAAAMASNTEEKHMTFYDKLLTETAREREAFLHIPLVQRSISHGASRETYIAFLEQAYHHVKHTFKLLALAASRTNDERRTTNATRTPSSNTWKRSAAMRNGFSTTSQRLGAMPHSSNMVPLHRPARSWSRTPIMRSSISAPMPCSGASTFLKAYPCCWRTDLPTP